MTADIIPFHAAAAARPTLPPIEDRMAQPGDRVVVLATGEVGAVVGETWAGGVTKALVQIDGGFTRAIHPIRIAPLAATAPRRRVRLGDEPPGTGPQPGGSAA